MESALTALEGAGGALIALLAGALQGISEWLPVSSKTLLLLLFFSFGVGPSDAYLLGLFLNGATVVAAIAYFRKDVAAVLRALPRPKEPEKGAALLRFLAGSILSTILVAVPLAIISLSVLQELRGAAIILVGVLLAVTGALSWWRRAMRSAAFRSKGLGVFEGLAAGAAQGFSALPGVSRSGVTLFALLLMGYEPREALRLSFLMGIPATLGGSIYAALTASSLTLMIPPYIGFLAFAAATAVSIPMISALLKLSTKLKTHVFTFGLAALTIIVGAALL